MIRHIEGGEIPDHAYLARMVGLLRTPEMSPAVLLVSADHTGQAALLGAITGLILSIFMICSSSASAVSS